jgi:23S rRNA (guanosine2251-2'-O)-methyltransferase
MQVIYGINPLLEIFAARPAALAKIVVAGGRRGEAVERILRLAHEYGVPVETGRRERLEKMAPGRVHQGIAGLCRDVATATLDEVIANQRAGSPYSLVILLDGVTDPQNLGSVIRTACCCGANGIVIPEDRAAAVTAAVAKASAGAVHHLPTARVVNLVRAIEQLKQQGYWIYGAESGADLDIHSPDYRGHVGLVMGSEGRGIRPLVRKHCDFLISIPMLGGVGSLNVSVATGVILYAILRKWGKGT